MPESLIWHQPPTTKIWQWVSAHFTHISLDHLIWNVAAFAILGSIIEQTSRKVLGLSLAAGIVGVNIYLLGMFQMNAYAGLSGVLNALLITALYFLYKQPAYKLASALTLVASLLKISVEYIYDFSLFSNLPWPAVPEAHMAGLIGGIVLVLILEVRLKKIMKSELVRFTELPAKACVD
jgi:rhomboid family GlyGly-CTERM serine protease